MQHFYIKTLGCKVNQYESEAIGKYLSEKGLVWDKTGDVADVCIINTCTVTGKASTQSRNVIRATARNFPASYIIVTGCYAQTESAVIQEIEGVDAVVGHQNKLKIPELILNAISAEDIRPDNGDSPVKCKDTIFRHLPVTVTDSRTRPYLKIQDGCDSFCTYCIVPYARGRSRSMSEPDVIHQVKSLYQAGAKEIVVTGIHLGNYGKDHFPQSSLSELMARIIQMEASPRIRLSSIEPGELDSDLIKLTANNPDVICPHFHIPLQSGDDHILSRMGRPYTSAFFKDKILEILELIPDCAIGLDTLIGFPGETEAEFQNSYDLVASLPVSYLHVFPYSARKGTPAASYPDQLPKSVLKERAVKMRDLSDQKQQLFYQKFVGKTLDVLVTGSAPDKNGNWKGISPNYLNISFAHEENIADQSVRVKITDHTGADQLFGKVV